jgi:hypothetical protein
MVSAFDCKVYGLLFDCIIPMDFVISDMCDESILVERMSSVSFLVSRLGFLAYGLVSECIKCITFK